MTIDIQMRAACYWPVAEKWVTTQSFSFLRDHSARFDPTQLNSVAEILSTVRTGRLAENSLVTDGNKKPIKIATDTNEFQIGMSGQNNNCNKNDFEKKLRDPKRKIKAKNKGP